MGLELCTTYPRARSDSGVLCGCFCGYEVKSLHQDAITAIYLSPGSNISLLLKSFVFPPPIYGARNRCFDGTFALNYKYCCWEVDI